MANSPTSSPWSCDDGKGAITDIVRGADFLDSTPRQIYLQRLLGSPNAALSAHSRGAERARRKLSKQTGARRCDASRWKAALSFLGQPPAEDLAAAVRNWDPRLSPQHAPGSQHGKERREHQH